MSTLSPAAGRLLPSAVPASVSMRAGQVHLVSLLGSWTLGVTLPVDVNHPESQEVFGQKLEACLHFGKRCCLWGRVCPRLLPPVGDGPVRRWLAFSGICSVLRSGNWWVVTKFRAFPNLILSLLLSHSLRCYLRLAPSDCSQGIWAGPYPKQCHPLLSVPPPLAGGGCERLGYFSAGSCFQAYNLWVLFIFPRSQVALRNSKTSPRPTSERVSCCLETSSIEAPFPGRISVPNSTVSLLIFYILSYILLKTMGCFSGCLMSSASHQKLFCGVCSSFKYSFDEFVGEKVVFPSYSSAILVPSRLRQ